MCFYSAGDCEEDGNCEHELSESGNATDTRGGGLLYFELVVVVVSSSTTVVVSSNSSALF